MLTLQDRGMEVAMSFIVNETEERIIDSYGIIVPFVIQEKVGLIVIHRTYNLAGEVVLYG